MAIVEFENVTRTYTSGEHMICVADKNQLMPDYTTFGYAYISPKKLRSVMRNRIEYTYIKELKKTTVPKEFFDESLRKMLITDDMLDENLDKAYARLAHLWRFGYAYLRRIAACQPDGRSAKQKD